MFVDDPTTGEHIGWEKVWSGGDPYIDISLVVLYKGKRLQSQGWTGIPTNPIVGRVGEQACIVGSRAYRHRCGAITAVEVAWQLHGYNFQTGLQDKASYCSWHGDS